MRVFYLELKRILRSHRVLVLLASSLILSVVMAYLPITYESISVTSNDGIVTELKGKAAIAFRKDISSDINGEITPVKIEAVLETYQNYVNSYGSLYSPNFPLDIYIENIMPLRPIIRIITQVFTDPMTGSEIDLMNVDLNDTEDFYEKCGQQLKKEMQLKYGENIDATKHAVDQYSKVNKPFQFYAGLSTDAFDYIEFYILILTFILVAALAPVFSDDYQTGSFSIFCCTKYGRTSLAVAKILASSLIFVIIFVLGITIHLFILNSAYGVDSLKTSFQMLFSVTSLSNIDLGHAEIFLVLAGAISIFASIACTLFISACCRNTTTALMISLALVLLPGLLHVFWGTTWISNILPSAGVGLNNNFLYQLTGLNYLNLGNVSFWTPNIIIMSALIEIPAFIILAIRTYAGARISKRVKCKKFKRS